MAQNTTSGPQQQVPMPAVDLRQLFGALVATEGTRFSTDLAVTQRGAGANMSVDVSAGSAVVSDDHAGGGGMYGYTQGATVNVAVGTADATNPRIDRVVLRVRDQALGDAANDVAPIVVAGTATAGATLVNLTGAAAVPASSLLLANILVPAASSSVTTANIDATVKATVALASGMVKLAPNPALTAAAASIDIQNLSTAYTDLHVRLFLRGDTAAASTQVAVRFNNDSGSNYFSVGGSATDTGAAFTGQVAAAASAFCGFMPANTASASYFSVTDLVIPNYANTSTNKTFTATGYVFQNTGTGNQFTFSRGGAWASSAAINRLTFLPAAGNFVQFSRVTVTGES